MKKLSLWAQGLAESDPTIVVDQGERLSGADQRRIDAVVERLRLTRENGQPVLERPSASGWLRGTEFLVRTLPVERDFKGRNAPVLIGGMVPPHPAPDWGRQLATAVEDLLRTYGFSLAVATEDDLQAVTAAVQKKAQSRSRLYAIALVASALALLLAFLLSRGR
jgi:hypothetical protein